MRGRNVRCGVVWCSGGGSGGAQSRNVDGPASQVWQGGKNEGRSRRRQGSDAASGRSSRKPLRDIDWNFLLPTGYEGSQGLLFNASDYVGSVADLHFTRIDSSRPRRLSLSLEKREQAHSICIARYSSWTRSTPPSWLQWLP